MDRSREEAGWSSLEWPKVSWSLENRPSTYNVLPTELFHFSPGKVFPTVGEVIDSHADALTHLFDQHIPDAERNQALGTKDSA